MANENRRSYVKPMVESVSLVPGEAVLGACKTSNGGGQNTTGDCDTAGIPESCQNQVASS
jgi:hypothetical protein